MKIHTLEERIKNAEAKIAKKTATIEKKEALIVKKQDKIKKLGFDPSADKYEVAKVSNEAYFLMCDIDWAREDIERGSREINEIRSNLEKYRAQLAGELEREVILIRDIPESMKRMQAELVEEWDRWDKERRDRVKAAYKELGWTEFRKKYTRADYDFKDFTDEKIHEQNVQDAKYLIIDLYYRVKDITGEVTDWSGISAEVGTHGFTVLNGCVEGKEGIAVVESIFAGGYNIQRLHVRVLVHSR